MVQSEGGWMNVSCKMQDQVRGADRSLGSVKLAEDSLIKLQKAIELHLFCTGSALSVGVGVLGEGPCATGEWLISKPSSLFNVQLMPVLRCRCL